jgi:hypothetical protein
MHVTITRILTGSALDIPKRMTSHVTGCKLYDKMKSNSTSCILKCLIMTKNVLDELCAAHELYTDQENSIYDCCVRHIFLTYSISQHYDLLNIFLIYCSDLYATYSWCIK